jgi:hypothetical protein
VRRIAVFVATTSGPVRIERITRERAPQSMVCLRRSSTVLPISGAYDSFVRYGSGVIEKTFGPFEDGAFRLDVSDPIETGESWQLGVFVAHALGEDLAGAQDTAESIVWLTGHVDYDLAVGSVGHLAEKVHASREQISAWIALGRSVTMIVPDGADRDAVAAAGVPDRVRLLGAKTAADALRALNIKVPSVVRSERKVALRAVGFAAVAIAGLSFIPLTQEPPQDVVLPMERMEAVALETTPAPLAIEAAVETSAPPTVLVSAPAIETVEVAKPVGTPAKQPHVTLFERRAPQGHTCAEVQFGVVEAVKVRVAKAADISQSDLAGLCGLAVRVDNGADEHFVAVVLEVISGKLMYGTSRPDIFGGDTAFDGGHEWPIDLPRRLSEPFEIRIAALSAEKAVAEQAQWFDVQEDAAAAAKELSAKGVATAMLHHRVRP